MRTEIQPNANVVSMAEILTIDISTGRSEMMRNGRNQDKAVATVTMI